MRPDRVVMAQPAFYDDLGLAQRVEYFAIEQFVAQACVKTLDVSVLPRAAWCDIGSLRTDRCNPCLHGLGDELRPIVGPYMARHATQDEQIGQHVDHVDGLELAAHPDRQAFMGELINHIEHAISPSVMCSGPPQSRRTRRDCGAPAAAECMIRRPARADRAWVVCEGP